MSRIKEKTTVEIEGIQIPYKVRISKRASRARIDINIRELRITIPRRSCVKARDFIDRKKNWILKKWKEFEKLRAKIPKREFQAGARWPYKGEQKTLSVKDTSNNYIENGEMVLSKERVDKNGIKSELESLYRKKAREYLTKLADKWCEKFGVKYKKIYIKNQKTRWGSCSSKKNLNLNWRLLMARADIIDYVIAHEVAHLVENNHSRKFWRLLSKYFDDVKKKSRWLKENGPKLIFTSADL
ncbi:MAG: M48 family metallopeptidase [Elusimicrobiota bacterium]